MCPMLVTLGPAYILWQTGVKVGLTNELGYGNLYRPRDRIRQCARQSSGSTTQFVGLYYLYSLSEERRYDFTSTICDLFILFLISLRARLRRIQLYTSAFEIIKHLLRKTLHKEGILADEWHPEPFRTSSASFSKTRLQKPFHC